MVKRVCLVSSGTGGHLWPAVVLANRLRDRGHETVLVTEGRGVEQDLLDRAGCDAAAIRAHGQRGRLDAVVQLGKAAAQARRYLREQDVDLVVATGGRTALSVGLAARTLRLPLRLLEQNAVTGRSNRVLLPFAERIYLGLPPRKPLPRSLVTGTPLREGFGSIDRAAAREALGLELDLVTVVVTGGSQGARVLNETVPPAVRALGRDVQIVHLAGQGHDESVRAAYAADDDERVRATVRAMALDVPKLFAAADLVVCRGGGCTVAELMAAGRPSIIVPYPHHRDHQQLHNGRVLEAAGAARVVEQSELSVATLHELLDELLAAPDRLDAMGRAAHDLAPRDPSAVILDDIEGAPA